MASEIVRPISIQEVLNLSLATGLAFVILVFIIIAS
jgi:hypothetical protein